MKSKAQEVIRLGEKLFNDRISLQSLWQDISDQFYPERATFTTSWEPGQDYAAHLMTGYPALQVRELADQLAGMLRPRSKLWAKIVPTDGRLTQDITNQRWLTMASEQQRRAMYQSRAGFLRATKTGDNDFVTFGQCVILPSLNFDKDGLLYRCFHLGDVAWMESANLDIHTVVRRDKMTNYDQCKFFPRTVSDDVKVKVEDDPYSESDVWHVVLPADRYDLRSNRRQFPFVSLFVDKTHEVILEEKPARRIGYCIPRWRLGPFKQYAVSPVTMLALPDSRLLQQMTLAMLEAAEKAANPPLVATIDVVRQDMQVFAGGITWVDRDYDERLGQALHPLTQDFRGIQYGVNMLEQVRAMLKETFFLNKIQLPEIGDRATAYEMKQRVDEYVRGVLPLFEPMETEYNASLCNETFAIMRDNAGFGPWDQMPPGLRGADVHFEFESPLQATAERAKVEALAAAGQIIQGAAPLDPTVTKLINVPQAVSDALQGAEVPPSWRNDPKKVAQEVAAMQQMQQLAGMAQMADKGGDIVGKLGEAYKHFMGGQADQARAQQVKSAGALGPPG
jgi:hypothetical protein